MRNSEYWKGRFEALNEQLLQIGDESIPYIEKRYDAAISNIQKEIEVFYRRFAAENELTYADAKKILDSDQRQEFQLILEDYIQKGKENAINQRWMKELENASTIYRMDWLRALQIQMRQQIELLEAEKEKKLHEVLEKTYEQGYYHTVYEIQRGIGAGSAFAVLDATKIEKVLSKPWAPDGKNFSQRLWGDDRTTLLYQLETRLTQGIIRGEGSDGIVKDISRALKSSKNAARRLVLTESAYFASASRLDAYQALEVEEYEFVATLDLKTSSLCRSMDGKVFNRSEYKVGLNAPPLHVYCRSTTAPYFNDEFTYGEERAARGENGKTHFLPADISYADWYEQYVKTNPNMLLQEKMLKNFYSDQKQYENYKNVLGRNVPKSFDMFREMKYNDGESWKYLKLDYARRNKLLTDSELLLPNADHAIAVDEKFTKYLFNPDNLNGIVKGKAFSDRLGYNLDNYNELQKEIIENAAVYPATVKGENEYGKRYEQKIILQGKKGKPANVIVGWIEKDGETKLTSAYIKEVKFNED